MKPSFRLLTPFLVAGLVAAMASAESRVRFTPQATPDVVVAEDACMPVLSESFARVAMTFRTDSTGKGTLRGLLGTPDLPFGQVAGSATVQLAVTGSQGGGIPGLVALSPSYDIQQVRGKWILRGGDLATGQNLALTTFVLRPTHFDTTGSLTVKWEADISPMTWSDFDPSSLNFGVQITLHDGANECVTGYPLLWEPLLPMAP